MRRLQTGEKIGDYRIVGFLGAGGMGEVYQGVHTRINRLAAIKILSLSANDPMFTARFLNEARVQSSLHHPNIVTLYDFKEINNQLFIFMEFADGDTLEDLIKRRFFAVEDALKTFESVCEAVAFMHCNGTIHRDIKAQNIKLTSGGAVKLLDFGIAKDAASQRLTKVGGVIGTPHYLAPEQLAGREATGQTDIWALGVLFYGMLTGVEPFKADTFGELQSQISAATFEPPEKANPAVPREVARIIAKCLEKNPENRYRTVDEILADARQISRGEKQRQPRLFGFKKKSENSLPNAASDDYAAPRSSASPKKGAFILTAAVSAAAVLLVFGIVGLGIWAMSGDSADVNAARNSPASNNPGIKNAKTTVVQSAPKSNPVRVLVETNGGAADVFRNNQLVGKTPFEIEGVEGETIDLTLRREGFQEKQVQFDLASRRRIYTFALQQK